MKSRLVVLALLCLATTPLPARSLSNPKPPSPQTQHHPSPSLSLSSLSTSKQPPILTRRQTLQKFLAITTTTSTTPLLPPSITNAILLPDDEATYNQEGIPFITSSPLGKSFRKSIIQGARVADSLDEQWESFSDKLRDKSQCDEVTGRRLYDNGKRKDGTSIGNPGLGALCDPEPLKSLNEDVGKDILGMAVEAALIAIAGGGTNVNVGDGRGKEDLEREIQQTKDLVRASFERSIQSSSRNEDEQKRKVFNFEEYSTLRAINNYLSESTNSRASIKQFQSAWGQKLVSKYAPNAGKKDYVSPFPEKDEEFQDYDYDKNTLLEALGKLKVVLDQLKSGGIIGYYEISIPYDDFGSVVTVAIDDYVPIGAEILMSEQKLRSDGPIQALVRYLFDEAKIKYDCNTFFIDPSTTRQSDYNPTQLLLSLNGLTKM